jgi:predicted RNA-binding Zn-ribbon protein involved in translation (DUF1610 family)
MNSFNENCDIENLLANGFKDNRINFNDLALLTKKYYWNDGYKKSKITDLLVEFSKKWDKNFNEIIDRKTIKDAVNNGMKRNIRNAKEINIYKEEIELIENIGDFKYQKIAFIMLFLSKMNHSEDSEFYNLSRDKDALVIKLSQANISKKEYKFLLQVLEERKFIFVVKPGKNEKNYEQILYAKKEGEVVFAVGDNNAVQKYVDYYGGEFFYCSNCGKKVMRKTNNQYLCGDCWKEKRRTDIRKSVNKFRNQ